MIPISTWQNIRPEILRKKRMMDRQLALIRQQEMARQNAGRDYYGDNLR